MSLLLNNRLEDDYYNIIDFRQNVILAGGRSMPLKCKFASTITPSTLVWDGNIVEHGTLKIQYIGADEPNSIVVNYTINKDNEVEFDKNPLPSVPQDSIYYLTKRICK